MTPLIDPSGPSSNVSWLSGAPVTFSKLANVTSPTVPPPGLSIVHVLSGAGPKRGSVPGPPSKKTGSEPVAIGKESLPPPPATEIELMPASGRLVVEPSTVSVSDVASAATEIVCADESARDSVHGAGTGGEGPLPGFEAGSIDGRVALLGVVVESVGATGVAVVLESVDE